MTHLGDAISAFLDGELSPTEVTEARTHLADCELCAAELAQVSSARMSVRSLPLVAVPDGLLPEPARRRRPRPWLVAAATATATVVAAVGIGLTRPAPPDVDLDALAGRHVARVAVDPGLSALRGPGGTP